MIDFVNAKSIVIPEGEVSVIARGEEILWQRPGYVTDGLLLWYDAKNNTGAGHSETSGLWKNLAGDMFDGVLNGFDFQQHSGWGEDYLQFDGSNDYVLALPSQNVLGNNISFQYTIEADINRNYLGVMGGHNNLPGLVIGQYADGKIQYSFFDCGSLLDVPYSDWKTEKQTICYVIENGAQHSLYINGRLYATDAFASPFSEITSGNPLLIGNGYDPHHNDRYMNGKIYDVLVYTKALTAQECASNYQEAQRKFLI